MSSAIAFCPGSHINSPLKFLQSWRQSKRHSQPAISSPKVLQTCLPDCLVHPIGYARNHFWRLILWTREPLKAEEEHHLSWAREVRMLWDHSTGTSEPAQEISRDSTTSESVHGETVEKSLSEDETLLLVNIPTENRFSPLQSSACLLYTSPSPRD